MAAISLGVSEIEERLEDVRRRLNLALTLRIVCVALTVLCGVFAMAVLSGLHHWLADRDALAGVVTLTLFAAGGLCAWWGHRHWVDLPSAARVADDRAKLADRLTTLVGLRQQRRTLRLMPVLVSQVVSLMPRWQPSLVVPFEIPREAYTGGGSLLALLLALWLAPAPPAPPAPVPQPPAAPMAAPVLPPVVAAKERRAPGKSAGIDAPKADDPATADPSATRDSPENQDEPGDAPQETAAEAPAPGLFGQVSNSLQDAMAGAFYKNRPDAGRPGGERKQLGRENDSHGGPKSDPSQAGERLPATEDQSAPAAEAPPSRDSSGSSSKSETAAAESKSGKDGSGPQGEQQDAKPSSFDGESPKAGGGSGTAQLLDPNAPTGALATAGAPQTFKLTITSFLQSTESRKPAAKRSGKRGGAANGSASASAADPNLSDSQQNDDAMRKAEIPAEFEEIVRRVYSARADQ